MTSGSIRYLFSCFLSGGIVELLCALCRVLCGVQCLLFGVSGWTVNFNVFPVSSVNVFLKFVDFCVFWSLEVLFLKCCCCCCCFLGIVLHLVFVFSMQSCLPFVADPWCSIFWFVQPRPYM